MGTSNGGQDHVIVIWTRNKDTRKHERHYFYGWIRKTQDGHERFLSKREAQEAQEEEGDEDEWGVGLGTTPSVQDAARLPWSETFDVIQDIVLFNPFVYVHTPFPVSEEEEQVRRNIRLPF